MTRRMKRKILNWFWRIAILFVILLLISITGNQQSIMVMQTDTLDKLNEISIAIDPEDQESTKTQPPDPVSSIKLTPEEREQVFRVVMSESGDQDLQGQMAVAQTIYDRMNDFGDTLPKAIETYSQHDNGDPTSSVKLAVANVFDGGMRVFEGGTYQVHNKTVDPYWTEGKIYRGSIGNLEFYGGYESN